MEKPPIEIYYQTHLLRLWMNFEWLVRPLWSLLSSVKWSPVSKPPSPLAPDAFISNGETPKRVAEHLRTIATSIRTG